ncbi:MAG: hypothetical protein AB1665_03455, partial [Candidatus Thermoplasmatota archaeon]
MAGNHGLLRSFSFFLLVCIITASITLPQSSALPPDGITAKEGKNIAMGTALNWSADASLILVYSDDVNK